MTIDRGRPRLRRQDIVMAPLLDVYAAAAADADAGAGSRRRGGSGGGDDDDVKSRL